jgi:hypothetical protein
MSVIIKLSEKGVLSIDADVTAETQLKALRFLEHLAPAISRLDTAAREQRKPRNDR